MHTHIVGEFSKYSFRATAVFGLIIHKEVLETSKSPWWSLAVPDAEDLLRCESAHARNMINQMMGTLLCALYYCCSQTICLTMWQHDELYDWHVHCRTVTLVGQWTGYGQDVSNNTFNFWSLFTAFLAHYPFPFFSHVPFWWKEWRRVLVTDPFNAWPSLTGDKLHLWNHNTSWALTTPSSQLESAFLG